MEKNRIFAFELCASAETSNHFEGKIITALMLLEKSGNLGNSQDIITPNDKVDTYTIA